MRSAGAASQALEALLIAAPDRACYAWWDVPSAERITQQDWLLRPVADGLTEEAKHEQDYSDLCSAGLL